jgi:hypothetical protein
MKSLFNRSSSITIANRRALEQRHVVGIECVDLDRVDLQRTDHLAETGERDGDVAVGLEVRADAADGRADPFVAVDVAGPQRLAGGDHPPGDAFSEPHS